MAVAGARRLVVVMVAVVKMVLLLLGQHLAVVLGRRRANFDAHARRQIRIHKSGVQHFGEASMLHIPTLAIFVRGSCVAYSDTRDIRTRRGFYSRYAPTLAVFVIGRASTSYIPTLAIFAGSSYVAYSDTRDIRTRLLCCIFRHSRYSHKFSQQAVTIRPRYHRREPRARLTKSEKVYSSGEKQARALRFMGGMDKQHPCFRSLGKREPLLQKRGKKEALRLAPVAIMKPIGNTLRPRLRR